MKYLKNVTSLKVDTGECTGCGACVDVCPHRVLAMEGKKVHAVDPDACMECGACSTNCPRQAITVQKGVGCAYAIFRGMITGGPPDCGCGCDLNDQNCC